LHLADLFFQKLTVAQIVKFPMKPTSDSPTRPCPERTLTFSSLSSWLWSLLYFSI